jgi:CheY-like chemotaxis protein
LVLFLKLFIALIILGATTLFAINSDINLGSISHQILVGSGVSLLILLALLFYIRSLKRKNREFVVESSTKSVEQYKYINENVNDIMSRLKCLSKVLEDCSKEEKKNIAIIFNKLFYTLKELNIFLDVKTDSVIQNMESFNLEELVKSIDLHFCEKDKLKELNIITNSNISSFIIADKKLLRDIFTLTALHQFKEHNCMDATLNIELLPESNQLKISVDKLQLTREIKEVINNNLNPIYNSNSKKLIGVYLNLLKALVEKLNGKLEVNLEDEYYSFDISIPVQIERINEFTLLLPNTIERGKRALIINHDPKIANSIINFLNIYKFIGQRISPTDITKIENFQDYDILIVESEILTSIVADYLYSMKEKFDFRLVSIESSNKKSKYKIKDLVDFILTKPILQSKIYKMILTLYHHDLEEKQERERKKNYVNNRVLIAEYDRVNSKLLKYLISSYNIDIVRAKDGAEVLEILKDDKDFNLIIIDSALPNMNGYETAKRIREKEEYNSIPIILHSSFSSDNYSIEDIFKLGFDSYLPKPFTKDKLLSILDRYLHINKKREEDSLNSSDRKSLEEFLAIYSDFDKVIEKSIKENRYDHAISMLGELRLISERLNQKELLKMIDEIEKALKKSQTIDNDLLYELYNTIKNTKNMVAKKLEKDAA